MPDTETLTPFVPRELVVAPFFAAVKQTKPRELVIDGKKWAIGIAHPTKRRESPALDMRHARACFALLTFRDRLHDGRTIHFSMNEFCKRYAKSQGGRFARDVLNLLYDLQETFVSREIEALDAKVLGVSGDNPFAQAEWAAKEGITIPLLSDYEHKAAEAYGIAYEQFLPEANLIMGGVAKRSAFVIDKEGVVQYAEVCEHPKDVPDSGKVKAALQGL